MMATLLLRLAAPLQAWGVESKFETRRTLPCPTKSGVIGMLASALGADREAIPAELLTLEFGVRVDREGTMLRDYHTAVGDKPYITERFYLADAVFLVGVSHPDPVVLQRLEHALLHPAYPLYLGRRACPPTQPLVLGLRDKGLLQALQTEPWLLPEWRQSRIWDAAEKQLRIITDGVGANVFSVLRDNPVSFSLQNRRYAFRSVKDHGTIPALEALNETEHDPMKMLEEE